MGGGLLQLIAVGQIDSYLSINPDFSFYKYSYKKHANFSMESIQLLFDNNPVFSPKNLSTNYQCKIVRYGDLLGNLYFCYTLPDIYSSDKYKFKWIKNVGSIFVKKVNINIDGMIIDQLTGEWMNIWNELSMPATDNKYDNMIGNVPEIQTPQTIYKRVTIENNKFIYNYYPTASKDDPNSSPSIVGRKITLPLNFWFTKNPALALPLLRLQFNNIYVNFEIETSENLYQVFSPDLNMHINPIYYNELYNDNIDIMTFTKNFSIKPYIEANYIFLGEEERNSIFLIPKLTYLVEQLEITTAKKILSNTNASHTINLNIHKPTKEIIWTTKRDDNFKFNDFSNYTASIPENTSFGILDKASIIWNRTNNRIEEKSSEYFNLIQPYQHHSHIPRQGIYTYSFAIYPEKEFASGYFNASVINSSLMIYLKDTYDNSYINNKLIKFNKNTYNFDYIVDIYCITYNIFEVVGGTAGMKFA